jgi:hypothetical protein
MSRSFRLEIQRTPARPCTSDNFGKLPRKDSYLNRDQETTTAESLRRSPVGRTSAATIRLVLAKVPKLLQAFSAIQEFDLASES